MIKRIKKFFRTLFLFVFIVLAAAFVNREKIEKAFYPINYESDVEFYAREYGVDRLLVYTVIRTESGFDPSAVSEVEARGLMQITQETFEWLKSKIAPHEDVTFDDLFDPQVNIRFGVYYLSLCLNRYNGDVRTALAAYHSGWTTVDNLLRQEEYAPDGDVLKTFPYPQMNRYVVKIEKNYLKYQELYN